MATLDSLRADAPFSFDSYRKAEENNRSRTASCGRRGDLVVSALDCGSRGPGSSPSRVIALCSWARHFTLTVPLSTQEYKWVPANCQGNLTKCCEVTCDGLASHPGGVAILLVASCYGNRDKLRQSCATRLVRLDQP